MQIHTYVHTNTDEEKKEKKKWEGRQNRFSKNIQTYDNVDAGCEQSFNPRFLGVLLRIHINAHSADYVKVVVFYQLLKGNKLKRK